MVTHRPRRRQAGVTRTTIVLVVLLFAAAYLVATFSPPYIRNWQLQNAFDDEARRAHLVPDEEMRRLILRKAREIGFRDWEAADIGIERDAEGRTIAVWSEYDVDVTLLGWKTVTLHFAPAVDREIERR